MANRRMMDLAFCQSEKVASLHPAQRFLFMALITGADDQGRMRAHPALIRSKVYPYDDIGLDEIADDLAAIKAIDGIILYKANGKALLQIRKWWIYQKPRWAWPSDDPPPPDWEDRLHYRKGNQVITHNWGDDDSDPEPPPSPDESTVESESDQNDPTMGLDEPIVETVHAGGPSTSISTSDSNRISTNKLTGADRAPPEVMPDPANLTVQQIKALELSESQWLAMNRAESKGKNRKSVIAHCKQMLNIPSPAILAFQEATGRFPKKPLWDGIVRVVGDDPEDVEFWRQVGIHYLACGWNGQNVKGMLEWYQKRELPAVQKPSKNPRRQQSTAADFARSEYAKPADTPTRAPPTEAERIWSEVVAMWRGSYPQLAEIRAIPGDAADGIMLAGNRQVVEPVKARMGERLAGWVDDAAGRPLEIRWVGDTAEVE